MYTRGCWKKTGGYSRLKEVGLEKQVSVDRKSCNHFARDFIVFHSQA